MRKRFFIFVSLILVFAFFMQISCSAADPAAISEAEAKGLILKAFKFYYKYQLSDKELIVKKSDISSEAKEIYTDDIADDMWQNRCYGKCGTPLTESYESWSQHQSYDYDDPLAAYEYYQAVSEQLYGNNGLTYNDNNDGTVTIIPFAASVMDWKQFTNPYYGRRVDSQWAFWQFVVSTEYSSDLFSERIQPKTVGDIVTGEILTENGASKTTVMIYSYRPKKEYIPIWVGVLFNKTSDGWRISGGDIVYVLSDWEKLRMNSFSDDVNWCNISLWNRNDGYNPKEQIPSSSNHLMANLATLIVSEAYRNIDPEGDLEPHRFMTNEFRFLYQKGNKACYEIEYICVPDELYLVEGADYIGGHWYYVNTGESRGMLTAEFTYDPDYSYGTPHSDVIVTGGWKLTGGEWYDLIMSNRTGPDTGDSGIIWVAAVSVLSLLGACILIRKRAVLKNKR